MATGTAISYRVFVRNWWRREYRMLYSPLQGKHIGKAFLVPDPGARKTTLAKHCTEEEARDLCQRYKETHKPGPLSRKAEYERE